MKRKIAKKVTGEKLPPKKTVRRVRRAKGRPKAAVQARAIKSQATDYNHQEFCVRHFPKVAIPITLASALVFG